MTLTIQILILLVLAGVVAVWAARFPYPAPWLRPVPAPTASVAGVGTTRVAVKHPARQRQGATQASITH